MTERTTQEAARAVDADDDALPAAPAVDESVVDLEAPVTDDVVVMTNDAAGDVEDDADEDDDGDDGGDADGDAADGASAGGSVRLRRLEREGDIAADYLEELLDIADLDGDIDMDVEGDRASVSIVGEDLTDLVGADGEVLEALQELTRLAVLRETGERSRLMLDVAGHRAQRRAELTALGTSTAAEVRERGTPVALPAMSPFERKVVHDAVAAAGLRSVSDGEEPQRYVVVHPA